MRLKQGQKLNRKWQRKVNAVNLTQKCKQVALCREMWRMWYKKHAIVLIFQHVQSSIEDKVIICEKDEDATMTVLVKFKEILSNIVLPIAGRRDQLTRIRGHGFWNEMVEIFMIKLTFACIDSVAAFVKVWQISFTII